MLLLILDSSRSVDFVDRLDFMRVDRVGKIKTAIRQNKMQKAGADVERCFACGWWMY